MKKGKFPDRAERLRLFFNHFSIRNVDAAKRLGLSRSAFISQLLNKDATITTDVAIRMGKAYPALDVDWLLHGEGEMLKSEKPAGNEVNEPALPYRPESPIEHLGMLLDDYKQRIIALEAKVILLESRLEGLEKGGV